MEDSMIFNQYWSTDIFPIPSIFSLLEHNPEYGKTIHEHCVWKPKKGKTSSCMPYMAALNQMTPWKLPRKPTEEKELEKLPMEVSESIQKLGKLMKGNFQEMMEMTLLPLPFSDGEILKYDLVDFLKPEGIRQKKNRVKNNRKKKRRKRR